MADGAPFRTADKLAVLATASVIALPIAVEALLLVKSASVIASVVTPGFCVIMVPVVRERVLAGCALPLGCNIGFALVSRASIVSV